eukprot:CAMPEP_0169343246 /NCGR_PEP_ID=MMETSP1017-20121227/20421_1 /TAXON_ID=342587 /ORGANISM="Karlodinium micrum, Strain CCMP2283" /LENGTH=52 /DNA_ID=CAMNT_0009438983 /DNA_START=105 /DNA_END=259 /DNA_ORIENTATION=+
MGQKNCAQCCANQDSGNLDANKLAPVDEQGSDGLKNIDQLGDDQEDMQLSTS